MSTVVRRIATSLALSGLLVAVCWTGPSAAKSPSIDASSVDAACPPATPGYASCLALHRNDIVALPASTITPSTTIYGYAPADLQAAYALPSATLGTGLTVAVVDAFDLTTAESDLAVYRSQFGLPACTTANGCFRKVDQNGGTSYPIHDAGWGQEISLDLDMVSAACPNCKILLVEADTSRIPDLGAAVDRAVALGAVAVSNSYGGPEFSNEIYADVHYDHPGVAIVAASGDCGYNCSPSSDLQHPFVTSVEYPAASQYVVAVGGTTLVRSAGGRGWTESAWGNASGGAGSGCSQVEAKPAWQSDMYCATRTIADVSAVADPATGVAVYDSDPNLSLGQRGWGVYGDPDHRRHLRACGRSQRRNLSGQLPVLAPERPV